MSTARKIVEQLIAEGRRDLRFDLNCRVEVWITADDLLSDPRARKIANGPGAPEQKIDQLRALAAQLAANRLSSAEGSGLQITCDGPTVEDISVDRIDWNAAARTDAERQAAEDLEGY